MRATQADLLALFDTTRNGAIGIGVLAALFLIGVGLPPKWKKIYKANIVPYLSIVLCQIAMWMPGLRPGMPKGVDDIAGIDGSEMGFRIGLGLALALACYLSHRIFPLIILAASKKMLPEKWATALAKSINKVW